MLPSAVALHLATLHCLAHSQQPWQAAVKDDCTIRGEQGSGTMTGLLSLRQVFADIDRDLLGSCYAEAFGALGVPGSMRSSAAKSNRWCIVVQLL